MAKASKASALRGKKAFAGPPACDKCGEKAAITLAYGPHRFCEKHFSSFFEARFRKTIRKYKLFRPREKLLVALSGGKDSVVTLHLLHKFYSKSNPIEALIINEGVGGYRDLAVGAAAKNCEKLGVDYRIVSFEEEFGITNDELMPLILKNPGLGGTCAFCGAMRRSLMNRYAKEMKAKRLVTGHNLDDEAQSVVMNVFNNDYDKFVRAGAGAGEAAWGFVKRIKPLYETPEKEVLAYASFNGIRHYSEECCPYSWTAKRNEFREMLDDFEKRFPGTKYSIVRFFESAKSKLPKKKGEKRDLAACGRCGEPTERELCGACLQIEKVLNKGALKERRGGKRKFGAKKPCRPTRE